MTMSDTRCRGGCGDLAAAFKEVTLAMTGVFRLHDADPELVESAAEALRQVFRGQMARTTASTVPEGRDAMQTLLDEIDAVTGVGD
jgi:hypothetical protein